MALTVLAWLFPTWKFGGYSARMCIFDADKAVDNMAYGQIDATMLLLEMLIIILLTSGAVLLFRRPEKP